MKPRAPRRGTGWFSRMLVRLHFYAGILIGPFIFVAAVSGALYALAGPIEKVVYQHELTAPTTNTTLTLAEQIEIAEAHVNSEAALSAIRPAPDPGDTTRVMFTHDGLGPSESRAIFVDPGTGEIRGDQTVYGTSGALPLRIWIDNLHRNLNLGDPGRFYSELAASWLGIVVVAGAALWIARIRTSRTKKDFIRPNPRYTGFRRLFSWHTSVGAWVILGALFLSATGITWSQFAGANVAQLRTALSWSTPSLTTTLDAEASADTDEHAHHGTATAPTGAANPATFDAVLAIGERHNIDTGLVEIRPPAEAGSAWVVQEIQRSHPTQVDAIAIDGTTLEVVDEVNFDDYPLGAKLTRWGIDLHMGSLFGLVNQIVLFFVASAIAAMVVLGYAMWIKRRPTKGGAIAGRAPAWGVVWDAPWWGIALVAAAGVLVGLWLPLVGWTLAVFVVIDTVIGLVRRRRRVTTP